MKSFTYLLVLLITTSVNTFAGFETGNGGDFIRKRFWQYQNEVLSVLKTTPVGKHFCLDYRLNVDDMLQAMEETDVVVVETLLIDNGGSIVAARLGNNILELNQAAWEKNLDRPNVRKLVFHEVLRVYFKTLRPSIMRSDNRYKVSGQLDYTFVDYIVEKRKLRSKAIAGYPALMLYHHPYTKDFVLETCVERNNCQVKGSFRKTVEDLKIESSNKINSTGGLYMTSLMFGLVDAWWFAGMGPIFARFIDDGMSKKGKAVFITIAVAAVTSGIYAVKNHIEAKEIDRLIGDIEFNGVFKGDFTLITKTFETVDEMEDAAKGLKKLLSR